MTYPLFWQTILNGINPVTSLLNANLVDFGKEYSDLFVLGLALFLSWLTSQKMGGGIITWIVYTFIFFGFLISIGIGIKGGI